MENKNSNFQKIHFVGIGGIGMSGIASILLKENKTISGSDLKDSPILENLSKQGAKIYLGHSKDNIQNDLDAVVYSSAIPKDNIELIKAKDLNIPVIKRAKMLAILMNKKNGIAVTGAHGKTTTTALISHILIEAGFNPTAVVGGILRNLENNAKLGDGNYFVIEADESDGSFLYYKPNYAVITNVDYEHMDYYKNWDNLLSAYNNFASQVKPEGMLYVNGDDKRLVNLLKAQGNRIKFFGKSLKNNIFPSNIRLNEFSSRFEVSLPDKKLGVINLPLAGEHNILNALASIGLCLDLGIDFGVIAKCIKTFKGTERRFQVRLKRKDITVIEDYGHHPTEIRAVLEAAGNLTKQRLVAVFQPHRYSRTKLLLDEFARVFALPDLTIITDIYAASEKPINGITGKFLREMIKKYSGNDCIFLPKEKITDFLFFNKKEGDLVLFLGAGDINKTAWEFVEKL